GGPLAPLGLSPLFTGPRRNTGTFTLPHRLDALRKGHVLADHRDLQNARDAARTGVQPRGSCRHLRTGADEAIADRVAAPALAVQVAALERRVLKDRENRGELVPAKAAPLPRRGIPQVLLEMRHCGLGNDLI